MNTSQSILNQCIHFINVEVTKTISLSPKTDLACFYNDESNQDSLLIKMLGEKNISGSTKSAESGGSTLVKNETVAKNSEIENKGLMEIIEALKFHISTNTKKKVIVPSLIERKYVKNSISMESKLPGADSDDEIAGQCQKTFHPFYPNRSNVSSNTSKRKVREINWPSQLQPEESFTKISE